MYIGLIATISDIRTVIIGVIISLIFLLVRFGAVKIATFRCSELAEEHPIMSVMLIRGLAAAVLATLPMQYADPIKYGEAGSIFEKLTSFYINLTVLVILVTAIIATVGIPILKLKAKK